MPSKLRIVSIAIANGLEKLSLKPGQDSNQNNQEPHPMLDGVASFQVNNDINENNLLGVKEGEDIEFTDATIIHFDQLPRQSQILPSDTIPSNITGQNNIIEGKAYKVNSLNLSDLSSAKNLVGKDNMETNQVETKYADEHLLIEEDIANIADTSDQNNSTDNNNGDNIVGGIDLSGLDSRGLEEDKMLEEIDVVSTNPEAPVTAAMRRARTEKKLAKQQADVKMADMQARIDQLEEDLNIVTEDLSASELEIADLNDKLVAANRQIQGAQKSFNTEADIAFELLSSAGIPSELPDGTQMNISDAIMYLLDQHSITSSTISILRNDLRKMAYKWRREGRKDDADYMFDMLANSSKQGSFIAVSSAEER